MAAEEYKTIVQRFFDEFCNAKKLDIADQLFTKGHMYHDPSLPDVPPGPDGMKQAIAIYHRGFPDAHWQVNEMLLAGNTVITRWTGSGTQTGELAGKPSIPPTRKKVQVEGIWLHRLAGDRIAESWNVWDTLGMLQQMGVIPMPATT